MLSNLSMSKKSERGQAMILIVFSIVGLIGMTALAIDGGNAFVDSRRAETAASAAAMTAATTRIEGGNWRAAALATARDNGYNNDGITSTVELNTPPIYGDYDGNPEYIVFNGRTGSISKDKVVVNQGDKVRMYVGNGGVNLISSFHLIGEIFDTVYPEAQMGGSLFNNVQTTIVPAGGAAITEFVADVPGTYVLVDHALARMDKGAWGTLSVEGEERPDIFQGDASGDSGGH
mgnify:CR=1 FL=1